MKSFMIVAFHYTLFEQRSQGGWNERDM